MDSVKFAVSVLYCSHLQHCFFFVWSSFMFVACSVFLLRCVFEFVFEFVLVFACLGLFVLPVLFVEFMWSCFVCFV